MDGLYLGMSGGHDRNHEPAEQNESAACMG
jgi:hypothetical protein